MANEKLIQFFKSAKGKDVHCKMKTIVTYKDSKSGNIICENVHESEEERKQVVSVAMYAKFSDGLQLAIYDEFDVEQITENLAIISSFPKPKISWFDVFHYNNKKYYDVIMSYKTVLTYTL